MEECDNNPTSQESIRKSYLMLSTIKGFITDIHTRGGCPETTLYIITAIEIIVYSIQIIIILWDLCLWVNKLNAVKTLKTICAQGSRFFNLPKFEK